MGAIPIIFKMSKTARSGLSRCCSKNRSTVATGVTGPVIGSLCRPVSLIEFLFPVVFERFYMNKYDFCYHTLHPLPLELAVLDPQTCTVVSIRMVYAVSQTIKALAMLIWLAELSSRDDPFIFFSLCLQSLTTALLMTLPTVIRMGTPYTACGLYRQSRSLLPPFWIGEGLCTLTDTAQVLLLSTRFTYCCFSQSTKPADPVCSDGSSAPTVPVALHFRSRTSRVMSFEACAEDLD